jgi:hypothetical protein
VVSFFVVAPVGREMTWRRKSSASSTSQGRDHDHLGNSNSAKCSFGRIGIVRCMVLATERKRFFSAAFVCDRVRIVSRIAQRRMSQGLRPVAGDRRIEETGVGTMSLRAGAAIAGPTPPPAAGSPSTGGTCRCDEGENTARPHVLDRTLW